MTSVNGSSNTPEANDTPVVPIAVNAQYVKDLSFECPDPLKSMNMTGGESPDIDLNVEVQAHGLGEDSYEVDLKITAAATRGADKIFVLELVYSGCFTLQGIPEEALSAVLLIECPRLLFPFGRSIVANITREAGFPPLSLTPVDFAEIYRRQMEAAQAESASATKQ